MHTSTYVFYFRYYFIILTNKLRTLIFFKLQYEKIIFPYDNYNLKFKKHEKPLNVLTFAEKPLSEPDSSTSIFKVSTFEEVS